MPQASSAASVACSICISRRLGRGTAHGRRVPGWGADRRAWPCAKLSALCGCVMVTDGAGQLDWADTADQASFRDAVRRFVRERAPARYRDQAARSGRPRRDMRAGSSIWCVATPRPAGPRASGRRRSPSAAGRAALAARVRRRGAHACRTVHPQPGARARRASRGRGPRRTDARSDDHGARHGGAEAAFPPPTLAGEMAWAQGYSEPGAGIGPRIALDARPSGTPTTT